MSATVATYAVRNSVAWLTMNRPEAANALNAELRVALTHGFERFAADRDAAVLVLTGAGEKAFSAGGDLKEMAGTELQVPPVDFVPQPGRTLSVDKPVIAAVNGVAYGGASSWPRAVTCAWPPITPASPSPRPDGVGARRGRHRSRGSSRPG